LTLADLTRAGEAILLALVAAARGKAVAVLPELQRGEKHRQRQAVAG
jgi:hypothetical protein